MRTKEAEDKIDHRDGTDDADGVKTSPDCADGGEKKKGDVPCVY